VVFGGSDLTKGYYCVYVHVCVNLEINDDRLSQLTLKTVRNKNDERPDFQDDNMVTTIKDNIDQGSTVFIVQAVDLDGDESYVIYSSPALIRPPLLQLKSGLIRELASLEGDILVVYI
jgi:predicted DNA-binding ArsR family transcriptional regulator